MWNLEIVNVFCLNDNLRVKTKKQRIDGNVTKQPIRIKKKCWQMRFYVA